MANLRGFNAKNVEPNKPFEAIPAGKYVAAIVESGLHPTRNGHGEFLKLTFEILEGEFKGRKLFARLNLQNENADAVRIAEGELSAICRAINVMEPNDSLDLHNLPMVITVKCKKREDNGEMGNEVKGYEPKEGGSKSAPVATPGGTPAPWKR